MKIVLFLSTKNASGNETMMLLLAEKMSLGQNLGRLKGRAAIGKRTAHVSSIDQATNESIINFIELNWVSSPDMNRLLLCAFAASTRILSTKRGTIDIDAVANPCRARVSTSRRKKLSSIREGMLGNCSLCCLSGEMKVKNLCQWGMTRD